MQSKNKISTNKLIKIPNISSHKILIKQSIKSKNNNNKI